MKKIESSLEYFNQGEVKQENHFIFASRRDRETGETAEGQPFPLAGGRRDLRRDEEVRDRSPGRVQQSDPARPVDQGEHGLRGTLSRSNEHFIESWCHFWDPLPSLQKLLDVTNSRKF